MLVVEELHQLRAVDRRIELHRGRDGVQPAVITYGCHSAVRASSRSSVEFCLIVRLCLKPNHTAVRGSLMSTRGSRPPRSRRRSQPPRSRRRPRLLYARHHSHNIYIGSRKPAAFRGHLKPIAVRDPLRHAAIRGVAVEPAYNP